MQTRIHTATDGRALDVLGNVDDIDRARLQLPQDMERLEAIVARHDIQFADKPA